MKGIHLLPGKAKIPGLGGREGTGFVPGSEGKARTLPGFVPVRLHSSQQKGHFVFFEAASLVFPQCGAALEALSASPTSLWISPVHTGLCWQPNSAPPAAPRGIFKWRLIPTPVEQVLLLPPSLSQKSLHLKHSNSSSPEPQILFLTDLHPGFTTCYWGVLFPLFVERPQVQVLSLHFSSKSVIEAVGGGFSRVQVRSCINNG